MSHAAILYTLNALTTHAGRLDKLSILDAAWRDGHVNFFRGLHLAYNPLISFGIAKLDEVQHDQDNRTFQDFQALADALAQRNLTGHAAQHAIEEFSQACHADAWNKFYRCILLKDMRCGISASTINKALKSLGVKNQELVIPEFPYQRCSLVKDCKLDAWDWACGVISQKKSDGMFVALECHAHGNIVLRTRAGHIMDTTAMPGIRQQAAKLPRNLQIHGEMLVMHAGRELPRETGNGMINSVLQGGALPHDHELCMVVWDAIALSAVVKSGHYDVPYADRLALLQTAIQDLGVQSALIMVETRRVHDWSQAHEHYQDMLAAGHEGTIIKEPHAGWRDGTSKFCAKLKLEVVVDLEVTGFNAGQGKNAATFGSMACSSSDGQLQVNVSGFSDAQRVDLHARQQQVLGGIVSVRGNGIMPGMNGQAASLFLPRFVEFRTDKTTADDMPSIVAQFANAKTTA